MSEALIWSLLVAYWAANIWFFDWLAQSTGLCLLIKAAASKRECLGAGGIWTGFDISGHAFLVGLAVGYSQISYSLPGKHLKVAN